VNKNAVLKEQKRLKIIIKIIKNIIIVIVVIIIIITPAFLFTLIFKRLTLR